MPGIECIIHVTKSRDYGIVVEGEMEMRLDSGETRYMKRGDVAVQRATMHGWKNRSDTEWARMFFVSQDCPQAQGSEM
jgi:quercetin dioxygenase-like cupin family protein